MFTGEKYMIDRQEICILLGFLSSFALNASLLNLVLIATNR